LGHAAFIEEAVKAEYSIGEYPNITIEPDMKWKILNKQNFAYMVFEGESTHYAGFFLVRKH